MIHRTSGIILHTTNYSDTSLIVKVYTSHFGLQSYIISGVRSKTSKNKAALIQPMALLDLQVSNAKNKNLQRVSEINNSHPYQDIPYNIIKSSIAIFLNEILYKAIREQHPDEDMFEYIKNSLLILDIKTDNCANFHVCFLIQLSRYLGFYPQGNYSAGTSFFDLKEGRFVANIPNHIHYLLPEYSILLDACLKHNYETIHLLKLDKLQRKELLQFLIVFYQLHITSFGEIKSIKVLEEVI
jgi:DNA repair protein RecO (recombination protein O)